MSTSEPRDFHDPEEMADAERMERPTTALPIDRAKAVAPRRGRWRPSGSYNAADRVALLTSLPFSQNISLINKVSMNQQADTLIMLLAVKHGQRTFAEGMTRILPFIQKTGIDREIISLSDGRGGPGEADLFSMRTVTRLLRYMTTRPDFSVYCDSMPVFGEVGSEVDTVLAHVGGFVEAIYEVT